MEERSMAVRLATQVQTIVSGLRSPSHYIEVPKGMRRDIMETNRQKIRHVSDCLHRLENYPMTTTERLEVIEILKKTKGYPKNIQRIVEQLNSQTSKKS